MRLGVLSAERMQRIDGRLAGCTSAEKNEDRRADRFTDRLTRQKQNPELERQTNERDYRDHGNDWRRAN
jgi:hypothetical protein